MPRKAISRHLTVQISGGFWFSRVHPSWKIRRIIGAASDPPLQKSCVRPWDWCGWDKKMPAEKWLEGSWKEAGNAKLTKKCYVCQGNIKWWEFGCPVTNRSRNWLLEQISNRMTESPDRFGGMNFTRHLSARFRRASTAPIRIPKTYYILSGIPWTAFVRGRTHAYVRVGRFEVGCILSQSVT